MWNAQQWLFLKLHERFHPKGPFWVSLKSQGMYLERKKKSLPVRTIHSALSFWSDRLSSRLESISSFCPLSLQGCPFSAALLSNAAALAGSCTVQTPVQLHAPLGLLLSFPSPLTAGFDFAPFSHNTSSSLQSYPTQLLPCNSVLAASLPAALLEFLPAQFAELLLGWDNLSWPSLS